MRILAVEILSIMHFTPTHLHCIQDLLYLIGTLNTKGLLIYSDQLPSMLMADELFFTTIFSF
jgi:hypothetical protein